MTAHRMSPGSSAGAPSGIEYAFGGGSGGGPGHGAGRGGGGSTKFCGGPPRHLQSQKHGGPCGHSGCFFDHAESWLLGKSAQCNSTTGGGTVVVLVVIASVVVVVVVGNAGSSMESSLMHESASSIDTRRSSGKS